jgi:hypothetical protein
MERLRLDDACAEAEPDSCLNCLHMKCKRINKHCVRLICRAKVGNGSIPLALKRNIQASRVGWTLLDPLERPTLESLTRCIQRIPSTWKRANMCGFFDYMGDYDKD